MSVNDPMMESKHHDPLCSWHPDYPDTELEYCQCALIAAAREEAAEAAMQIGRQIEKDNHAAGLCEPSYTHGREYQQQRLTNHDMHSGLACLTNYQQGQRDEREKWSVLIKDRIRDLQSCTKHDDCMGKADILLVILDDYDYGFARGEKS